MAWRALRERTRPPSAALLALAAALGLGVAGRIAVHALVAGTLAGEALLLATEWSTRAARAALAAEVAAAVAVLALGARRTVPLAAVALTALVALGVAGAEDTVRDTLRVAGWRGL